MSSAYRIPERLRRLAPSQIRENMRIAGEVGAINLAQGRPDFDPDPAVLEAAIEAIRAGHNQYSVTWGEPSLRTAIAAMLRRRFALDADPETEITVTCGVTEAIVASLLALVEVGDEVVVIEPAHENYVPAIHFAGGVPRYVALRPPDFRVPLDELERTVGPRTRALILNTPHNPSGRVLDGEETDAVLRIAERHGVHVITDEIYDHLVYTPHVHLPPVTRATDPDRVVTTGGLSKIYGATGWRLGYVVAEPGLSASIRTVHDFLTICAPTPFQHAAVVALSLPETYHDELRATFTARRARIVEILRATGFEPFEPEGAYYLLARFDRWEREIPALEFSRRLIEQVGIATVPGEAFYPGHPDVGRGLVRFAFAKSLGLLDEVERRLRAGFEGHPAARAAGA